MSSERSLEELFPFLAATIYYTHTLSFSENNKGSIKLHSPPAEPSMWPVAVFHVVSRLKLTYRSQEETPDIFITATLFCWGSPFFSWWSQDLWKVNTEDIICAFVADCWERDINAPQLIRHTRADWVTVCLTTFAYDLVF